MNVTVIRKDRRTVQTRMWQVMRRRRVFGVDDVLIPLEDVSATAARKFVRQLEIHGLIRFVHWHGRPGVLGSYRVYRIVKDTGPDAPTMCPACGKTLKVAECLPATVEEEQAAVEGLAKLEAANG
jgi:hypothetical protein